MNFKYKLASILKGLRINNRKCRKNTPHSGIAGDDSVSAIKNNNKANKSHLQLRR